MASITNVQAVTWSNIMARGLFDRICQFHNFYQIALAEFQQQGLATLIPNDGTQLVVDGSASDGRPPITGATINILLANAATLDAVLTANSNLVYNQTLQGSVNPAPTINAL